MKKRIDTFLVEHTLVESREQAKRLILAGAVTVNGSTRIKPGHRIPPDAKVVVQQPQKYVSRGGLKLEKALQTFEINVENRGALDVGASTGGFTDCLLQHGAKFVTAIDVGHGQFAWKLRTHPQVHLIEKMNIRALTPALLKKAAAGSTDLAVIDVSFISLRTVLPCVIKLLGSKGPAHRKRDILALIKPQFEAGKAHVKKGGIVTDTQVHIQTIDRLITFVTEKIGATVNGLTYSPIHKDIGNIEYFLWLTTESTAREHRDPCQHPTAKDVPATDEVVHAAHDAFKR